MCEFRVTHRGMEFALAKIQVDKFSADVTNPYFNPQTIERRVFYKKSEYYRKPY